MVPNRETKEPLPYQRNFEGYKGPAKLGDGPTAPDNYHEVPSAGPYVPPEGNGGNGHHLLSGRFLKRFIDLKKKKVRGCPDLGWDECLSDYKGDK